MQGALPLLGAVAAVLLLAAMAAAAAALPAEGRVVFADAPPRLPTEAEVEHLRRVAEEKKDDDEQYCTSIPKTSSTNADLLAWLQPLQNNRTDSCTSCTREYSLACSWCTSGRITGLRVLGVPLADVGLSSFCWAGAFNELYNNTVDDSLLKLKVVCDDDLFWGTCDMRAPQFMATVIVAMAVFCCCCCCCITWCCCKLCKAHHGGHHHHYHGAGQYERFD